jgi:hypothetical protein
MMTIKYLLLAVTVAVAAPVTAHAQMVEKAFSKTAVAGRTSTLDSYYAVKLDCAPIEWVEVRIVEPPQNGKAVVSKGSVLMYYPDTNPRKSCNGKPVDGQRLMYTPNDNAQGDDRIVVEVINSSGQNLKYTYDITVK